ncbi:methyl-accepting chemotaxis protein [Sporanaerobium hydrogeniformans]|uniref:Methyl-accepting chemotaxis protein n=1 Tax=Sporanaerobium hydrogeniformans TaxID=3072179 RepID=A0AC61DCD8_9FIRM|nr:methyl-accepting chemotaxis protein [Sporanaerobium hydrogeniformans]PHV70388.1 methyl-accepting chemotaxis protein [Sporanaerobium hydrogeniformans]
MKRLKDLKLSVKLILSFGVIICLSSLVALLGIKNIAGLAKGDLQLYEEKMVPLVWLGELTTSFQEQRVQINELIIEKVGKEKQLKYEAILETQKKVDELIEKLDNAYLDSTNKQRFEEFKALNKAYEKEIDKEVYFFLENDVGTIQDYLTQNTEMLKMTSEVQELIGKIRDHKLEDAKLKVVNNQNIAHKAQLFMTEALVGIAFISILLSLVLGRALTKPLNKLVRGADKIAEGDLSIAVESDAEDEVGKLAIVFNHMSRNISNIMQDINGAAKQIREGSKQVADASEALSQGTIEQASAVEELKKLITCIKADTQRNAENANKANTLTSDVETNALKGNEQMQQMLNAMEEILAASKDISKVIKVIDEIAFQTNILSLNAAVEAARAGQQGKGFAVVAEEVRNLADRSASAAKETTLLIEGSMHKSDIGMRLARDTAEALKNIVEGVQRTARLVENVAEASNEQAKNITRINKGIEQVAEVIQTNSATAEESAAASEELYGQAEILKSRVDQFKLKNE